MTRSVMLANLSASRATTNNSTVDGASGKAGQTDTASGFAQMLEDAGSTVTKPLNRDKEDERREAHSEADTVTVPVCLVTLPNTQSSEPVATTPASKGGTGSSGPSKSALVQDLAGVSSPLADLLSLTGDEGSKQSRQPIESLSCAPGSDQELVNEQAIQSAPPVADKTGIDSADRSGISTEADSSRTHNGEDKDALSAGRGETADSTQAEAVDAGTSAKGNANLSTSALTTPVTTAFSARLDQVGLHRPADFEAEVTGKKEPDASKSALASMPSRPQQAASVVQQAVSTTTAAFSVNQANGPLAVRVVQAMSNPTQDSRSDFVVSNTELTAALSKPQNEGDGIYSVTAALNPPSLGHVQAVVKVDGANVNISIVAHSPEGHRAIAGHLDDLARELQAHGGDVRLSLSDGGNTGKQRDDTEPSVAPSENDVEAADSALASVAVPQSGNSLHVIL